MRTRTTITAAAALLCAALASPASAADSDAPRKSHKAKPAASAPKGGRAKFMRDTGETPAERDRRLLRECKGRPNAGACLGYAS